MRPLLRSFTMMATCFFSTLSPAYERQASLEGGTLWVESFGGSPMFVPDSPRCVMAFVLGNGELCLMFCWDEPIELRIGSRVVPGDRVLMTPIGGRPLPWGSITGLDLLFAGTPTRTIVPDPAVDSELPWRRSKFSALGKLFSSRRMNGSASAISAAAVRMVSIFN